ncbi:solute carrier family 28 member 3-like isoform X2 [Ruditapes philippinarum]|uniref:solute carrier family 28 member 3-like isoform X2 n=1 Tax=Ruditapes philippinarum TaxID=129788 RepID=UPI00295B5EEB|nr:solute carrier family 28 member 3-like isoform X2 [Ruditapes philippinarum]
MTALPFNRGADFDEVGKENDRLFTEYDREINNIYKHKNALDEHIQLTVQRMSFAVEEFGKGTNVDDGKCCRKINFGGFIKRLIPLFILIGYLVYLGFALYLNPSQSVFVCVVAIFVIYICVNILTGGKISKFVTRGIFRVKKCFKVRNRRMTLWARRITTIAVFVGILVFLVIDLWDEWRKWIPLGGLALFVIISVVFSKNPRKIIWTPVIWGIYLQFGLGLLILRWGPGFEACQWIGRQVTTFLGYTDAGSQFVFGDKYIYHPVVFKILPVVVFFSSVVSILYYLGAMQIIIKCIAIVLQVMLSTTPIESFATAAHIFIGQVESSVALRPFWMKLTESELHAIMTSGFATVAGTIIAAYVEFGVPAEHVISASFMSAPAALAIAKISVPETEVSQIKSQAEIKLPSGQESNMIEALSVGATTAIKLVAYVVVNLIAFIAVLSFLDQTLSYFGERVNYPDLSFQLICSYIFMPLAAVIGVPWSDTKTVGALIGKKIVINEFLAYADLGTMIEEGSLDERSAVLATYILCGFGSIAALGINLGSLASSAPERRPQFTQLSLRSMINGNIACFMTACVAGVLFQTSPSLVTISPFMNTTEAASTLNFTLNTTLLPLFNSSQS